MTINPFYLLLFTLVYIQVARGQEENHLFLFDGQFQRTNPSIMGLKQESYLGFLIDSQWLGIKDAPKQQSIFYNSYKDTQNLNLGGVIRNRSRFGEQNIQLLLQSSYPIQINSESHLQFGLQVLGDYYSTEYNYLRSVDGIQNVSFWIPLDKINQDTSLKCVSGSHLWGKLHKPKRFNGEDLFENDSIYTTSNIEVNNVRYWKVPNNGKCSPANVCGGIYDSNKILPKNKIY